jgi:hypothetical protein
MLDRPAECPRLARSPVACTLRECRYFERRCRRRCALHEAEQGPHSLQQTADALGLGSRQRAQQIEAEALAKLREAGLLELPDDREPSLWDALELAGEDSAA